jgi:SAM-dependent methyltransferase
MVVPLAMAQAGVARQVVVDLRPLARSELIRDTANRLGLSAAGGSAAELLAAFGIDYQAPSDARSTGLADGHIDLAHSTDTLEHIPPTDIPPILAEVHRVLRPGGIASFRIDYQDHFSYFDDRRGRFDFLRSSPSWWRLANPALHYQNRLRHPDYLEMIAASGLELISDTHPDGDVRALPRRIHGTFGHYAVEDLAIPGATLVYRRPGAS